MIIPRRRASLIAWISGFVALIWWIANRSTLLLKESATSTSTATTSSATAQQPDPARFRAGTPKPGGVNATYSRTLVTGRRPEDDVDWLSAELPADVKTAVYLLDPHSAANTVSTTSDRGNGAMAYLTYIIDNYDSLPDVVLFMHPGRWAWHNNIVLDLDSAQHVARLSSAHVVRQGYVNLRCHMDPGCPSWLHLDAPAAAWDLAKKAEEPHFTSALWRELHPGTALPGTAISAPCCAQFAVSGARIRAAQPRAAYERLRAWLAATPLADVVAARVMEYSWHTLFTGAAELCPEPHVCYCDAFGACFGSAARFDEWMSLLRKRELADEEVVKLSVDWPASKKKVDLARASSERVGRELDRLKTEAFARGDDPETRAADCGREWTPGDGF